MKNEEMNNMMKYGFYSDNHVNEKYNFLCDFYKLALEKTLNSYLDIDKEEEYLNEKIFDLKINNNSNKCYCIYNKMHIERLDLNEINMLINKYNNNLYDKELFELIRTTNKKVVSHDNKNLNNKYYSDDLKKIYNNDTIIYIFKYNIFKLEEENFKERFYEIQNYVNLSKERILNKAKKMVDFNIDVVIKNNVT